MIKNTLQQFEHLNDITIDKFDIVCFCILMLFSFVVCAN